MKSALINSASWFRKMGDKYASAGNATEAAKFYEMAERYEASANKETK